MIKSPFSSRHPRDFRVLQVYPNVQMNSLMPQSIGIFTAIFKNEGYTVDLFDCTYYQDIHFGSDQVEIKKTSDKKKDYTTNKFADDNKAQPTFDTKELLEKGGAPKKPNSIKIDFIKKVQNFKPDLILLSVVESTWFLAVDLLKSIPEKDRNYTENYYFKTT